MTGSFKENGNDPTMTKINMDDILNNLNIHAEEFRPRKLK